MQKKPNKKNNPNKISKGEIIGYAILGVIVTAVVVFLIIFVATSNFGGTTTIPPCCQ